MIKYDYEIKNAFTLEDVADFKDEAQYLGIPFELFTTLCAHYGVIYTGEDLTYWTEGIGADLWANIWLRYSDHYIALIDGETFTSDDFKKWLKSFINVFNRTKEKYETLLQAYANAKASLMSPLTTRTTSKSRFNDTPQGTGDFSTDPFTTTITQGDSETITDVTTPIERLKEIEDNYSAVLVKWANAFNGIFIEEGNV